MKFNINKVIAASVLGVTLVSPLAVAERNVFAEDKAPTETVEKKAEIIENDFAVFTQDDDFYYLKLKVSGNANIKVDGEYQIASFRGDVIRVPKDKIKKDVVVSFKDKEYTTTKEELDKGTKLPPKELSPQEKFYKEWQEKHKDELKAAKENKDNPEEAAKLIAKYQEEFEAKFGENPLKFKTSSGEGGWFTPGAEPANGSLKFFIGKEEPKKEDVKDNKKEDTKKAEDKKANDVKKSEDKKDTVAKDTVSKEKKPLPKTSAVK